MNYYKINGKKIKANDDCPVCRGTGQTVTSVSYTSGGNVEYKATCYACKGTGKYEDYERWVWTLFPDHQKR